MRRWVRRTVTTLICLGLTVVVAMPVQAALVEAGVSDLMRTVPRMLFQLDKRLLANEKRHKQLEQTHNANRN
jgi:hypothetical protein